MGPTGKASCFGLPVTAAARSTSPSDGSTSATAASADPTRSSPAAAGTSPSCSALFQVRGPGRTDTCPMPGATAPVLAGQTPKPSGASASRMADDAGRPVARLDAHRGHPVREPGRAVKRPPATRPRPVRPITASNGMPARPQIAARATAPSTTEAPATPMRPREPAADGGADDPARPAEAEPARRGRGRAGGEVAEAGRDDEQEARKRRGPPRAPRRARPASSMTPPTSSAAGATSAPQPKARALPVRSRWPAGPSTLR